MEERREMNGQRMMTRDELEMRLPALNHIAEQGDAKFRLRYAEKTLNNGIERGYTLDAGTRVSVNVYQKSACSDRNSCRPYHPVPLLRTA